MYTYMYMYILYMYNDTVHIIIIECVILYNALNDSYYVLTPSPSSPKSSFIQLIFSTLAMYFFTPSISPSKQ